MGSIREMRLVWLPAAIISTATALGQSVQVTAAPSGGQSQQPHAPATLASTVDRAVSNIEKLLVDAAEAMPEEKFNFSPEGLNIPGADYKGVRTFALQVRHVAASNYYLWSAVTGDKIPDDYKGGNGPESLKTKAEIVKFLKDSFAVGHKAAASLTVQNMLETAAGTKSVRLHLATFGVAHA